MEVIQQDAKLITGLRPLELVEYAARVCYASTDKIHAGSAKPFVKALTTRGHYTPLEHAYLRIYPEAIKDLSMRTHSSPFNE